jgi:molybdate transport system substrate-binding protein
VNRRALVGALLSLALGSAAACRRSKTASGDAARERELVVFAASSLEGAFTSLASSFRAAHPGVEVKLSVAGTQQLRVQIEHGATFDVFAAADSINALALVRSRHLGQLWTFAQNELVIVVSPAAAGVVRRLGDLPKVERLVVGAPEVPIGRYTLEVLDRATAELGEEFRRRVEARIVSRELNVRQVLSRVVLGEAQAGIVYRSDAVLAKGRVLVVEIPKPPNAVAHYPIAVAARAPHPHLARAWVDLARSPSGRSVLTAAGFGVPEQGSQR